ncbi:hypothetical protein BDB01DRAFT_807117 [Pilobolus umbonatus]|nr:hypothetical protein BDB01DRAFT_807117 [Pilobolus umbonatus]
MKFTPKEVKQVLHDATKKVHISFDDPDAEKAPLKKTEKTVLKKTGNKAVKKTDKEGVKKVVKHAVKEKGSLIQLPGQASEPKKHNNATQTKKIVKDKKSKKVKQPRQMKKVLTAEEIKEKVAKRRLKLKLKKKSKQAVEGTVIKKAVFQMNTDALDHFLPVTDLREFILYSLSQTTNLPWCSIVNRSLIQHVMLMYAPGLTVYEFGVKDTIPFAIDLKELSSDDCIGKLCMPFLTSHTKHMLITQLSHYKLNVTNPVAQILQCPIPHLRRDYLIKQNITKMNRHQHQMRDYYILSLDELRRSDYPIPPTLDPTVKLQDGWKETHPPLDGVMKEKKDIVAVDCEMVKTVKGTALARITLVSEDGEVLLDELVKPEDEVVDYLTRYSGITPYMLDHATCSLRRAQKHVRKIVDHNVILVGHGLENDLKALKLVHPYCADTSLMYDHYRGPPYKCSLKYLTKAFLNRTIQVSHDDSMGHDSIEDAKATLELFKLKLANKPSFGRHNLFDTETVFDRLSKFKPSRSSAIIEPAQSYHAAFGSVVGNDYFRVPDEETMVTTATKKAQSGTHFLFTRSSAVVSKQAEEEFIPVVLPNRMHSEHRERANQLIKLDEQIKSLYEGLPHNSFMIIQGGASETPEYRSLHHRHINSNKNPSEVPLTKEEKDQLFKMLPKVDKSPTFLLFKD